MTAPAVELRGILRRHGATAVLEGVDLALAAGEIARLTGRSGAGKTTLLRIVAGLDPADAGEVWLGGRRASAPGPLIAPHDRGIGMMFQQPALWPHMTVADHVRFAQPVPDEGRLAALLARLGLSGLAESRPAALSGGEAARVALARALAPDPAVLLLDEPFAHLHAGLRQDLSDLLRETAARRGTAILVATHTPEDLAGIAGRSLHLAGGRLSGGGDG